MICAATCVRRGIRQILVLRVWPNVLCMSKLDRLAYRKAFYRFAQPVSCCWDPKEDRLLAVRILHCRQSLRSANWRR